MFRAKTYIYIMFRYYIYKCICIMFRYKTVARVNNFVNRVPICSRNRICLVHR